MTYETQDSILRSNKSILIKEKLNLEIMREALQYLLGEQDFSSFRASGCQSKTAMRDIKQIIILLIAAKPQMPWGH